MKVDLCTQIEATVREDLERYVAFQKDSGDLRDRTLTEATQRAIQEFLDSRRKSLGIARWPRARAKR